MGNDFKLPQVPKIPEQALEAICQGIEDEHPVCNLEPLLPKESAQRLINILEGDGILTLEHLMSKTQKYLMALENLGPKGLIRIFEALAKYHEFREEI